MGVYKITKLVTDKEETIEIFWNYHGLLVFKVKNEAVCLTQMEVEMLIDELNLISGK